MIQLLGMYPKELHHKTIILQLKINKKIKETKTESGRDICTSVYPLSHPYMTTGKTIALTRRTFVGKIMTLLLNMLSRLVIAFLPRSKRLLISWLQSPSAVILEPGKLNSVSTVSPSTSLISRGLNLPFGTLGSSRRLKKPFPTNTERIYTQVKDIGGRKLITAEFFFFSCFVLCTPSVITPTGL